MTMCAFVLGVVSILTGCASMVNGLKQPVEVTSERPGVRVQINKGRPVKVPVTLQLSRREQGQTMRILTPRADSSGGMDTVRILMEKRISHVVWLNLMGGYFGLIGLVYDMAAGGAWRIDPDPRRKAPAHVTIIADPDPWSSGEWKGSLAFGSGFKFYPDGIQPEGNVEGDIFFQAVAGHRDCPVLAEARGYFYSSLVPLDNFVVAEAGVRKLIFDNRDFRPYVSGGLSLLAQSTQANRDGLPLGFWTRAGVDIRASSAFFAAPYIGYSKYETVATGINTGGVTGGLVLGVLW
jgi:hypothetical protein